MSPKSIMKALIIANGSLPAGSVIRKLLPSCDIIVCADGGANQARKLHITPDIILGDMDSITKSTRTYFSRIPLLVVKDQNSTDLEKAITYCIRQEIKCADVIGALGGRIDHSTGSLGCFPKFRHDIHLRMFDSDGVVT